MNVLPKRMQINIRVTVILSKTYQQDVLRYNVSCFSISSTILRGLFYLSFFWVAWSYISWRIPGTGKRTIVLCVCVFFFIENRLTSNGVWAGHAYYPGTRAAVNDFATIIVKKKTLEKMSYNTNRPTFSTTSTTIFSDNFLHSTLFMCWSIQDTRCLLRIRNSLRNAHTTRKLFVDSLG